MMVLGATGHTHIPIEGSCKGQLNECATELLLHKHHQRWFHRCRKDNI